MRRTVLVLSALTLTLSGALSACGGGGDEETAKKNLAADFAKEDSLGASTEEQATCVADGAVDDLGVDKLQEYKILDEDLKVNQDPGDVKMEQEDAETMASVVVDCIDAEEFLNLMMGAQADQLPPEAMDCIRESLTDDALKELLTATFAGDTEAANSGLQKDMMECVMGSAEQ